MKSAPILLFVLTLCATSALADPVQMVCRGKFISYLPEHTEGTVGPESATVDIENRRIATPFGTYAITEVSNSEITFGNRATKGTLDRVTGIMRMFARPDGDKTDMQTSFPKQVKTFSELKCAVAKRLF